MGFIIVQTINEYPVARSRQLLINSDDVRNAVQEYSESLDPFDFFTHVTDEEEETLFPVVHLYFKFSLNVFPGIDISDPKKSFPFEDDRKYEQRPKDRPTEIWVPGLLLDWRNTLELANCCNSGVDVEAIEHKILVIRVGETLDEESNVIWPAGASSASIYIPRIVAGETWVTLDGIEPAIMGTGFSPSTMMNYQADDSAENLLNLSFDNDSGEGLPEGSRIHIHYTRLKLA